MHLFIGPGFLKGGPRDIIGAVTQIDIEGHGRRRMYGLIGKIEVEEGRREELVGILLEGVSGMPGCLSYVVADDVADENAIWVTEVWDSRESHEGSLSLPSVQEAIRRGRPMIRGFGERFVTRPVGGHGIVPPEGHG